MLFKPTSTKFHIFWVVLKMLGIWKFKTKLKCVVCYCTAESLKAVLPGLIWVKSPNKMRFIAKYYIKIGTHRQILILLNKDFGLFIAKHYISRKIFIAKFLEFGDEIAKLATLLKELIRMLSRSTSWAWETANVDLAGLAGPKRLTTKWRHFRRERPL